MKVIINAEYYRDAGRFVTKEQSRYTLSAVRLEPHPESGVIIIATDGHTMCLFHDAFGECDEPLNLFWHEWVADHCKAHRCLIVDEDRTISVRYANHGSTEYLLSDRPPIIRILDLIADAPDIQFPTWRAVLPEPSEQPPMGFNPEFLSRCELSGRNLPITLFVRNNESQVVVTSYDRPDFAAIVMPVKMDGETYPSKFLEAMKRPAPERDAETDQDSSAQSAVST